MLRSSEEQLGIIYSFAGWLKISPMRMQFKSITRRADTDRHICALREEIERERDPHCRQLGEGYIGLIKDVGSREALTRRFFLIFSMRRGMHLTKSARYNSAMQTVEQNARAVFIAVRQRSHSNPPILMKRRQRCCMPFSTAVPAQRNRLPRAWKKL